MKFFKKTVYGYEVGFLCGYFDPRNGDAKHQNGAVILDYTPLKGPHAAEFSAAVERHWNAIDAIYHVSMFFQYRDMHNEKLHKVEFPDGWQQKLQTILNQTEWEIEESLRSNILQDLDEIQRRLNTPRRKARQQTIAEPRPGYVYLLRSSTGNYKIGKTSDPNNRLKTFEVKLPFEVGFECLIPAENMHALEKALHATYADKRTRGEWFSLDADDVATIKRLAERAS